MKNIIDRVRTILSQYKWNLAYGEYSDDIITDGIDWGNLHILKNNYKTKWFADPFILDSTDDTITLLVEEFDSNVKRGRIARIVANRKTQTIEDCSIILDLPTHLSFPAIYNESGIIYVHPENSASGKSTMYRYDRKSDKLVEPIVVADLPLVDAVIRKKNGKYTMYATSIPDAGGKHLIVLESDKLTGPYKEIGIKMFERREARMAGAFIESKKGLIRPAQDCNRDYGEAVLFYKGDAVIYRQKPGSWMYEGLHTFNSNGSFYIVDLKKYNHPFVHQALKAIKGIYKKLIYD